MPGLDQRGPEGRGAMTGRRQGICQTGQGQRPAAGGFAGGRGRGCRRGGAGRGFGRGYGAGPVTDTQSSLQDRARILEDELAAVKDQLNAMSEKA